MKPSTLPKCHLDGDCLTSLMFLNPSPAELRRCTFCLALTTCYSSETLADNSADGVSAFTSRATGSTMSKESKRIQKHPADRFSINFR